MNVQEELDILNKDISEIEEFIKDYKSILDKNLGYIAWNINCLAKNKNPHTRKGIRFESRIYYQFIEGVLATHWINIHESVKLMKKYNLDDYRVSIYDKTLTTKLSELKQRRDLLEANLNN